MTNQKQHHSETDDDTDSKRVTLRDIAREMGISHVTVSKALRNQPRVSASMKARVQAKAKEMGYQPDPMLSTLAHYRRSSKTKPITATLAWLNTWPDPEQIWTHNEFHLYWEGAKENAHRLGFKLEAFNLTELSLNRLKTVFNTRCIQGILLPPIREPMDRLTQFDWSDFALVRFGHSVPLPKTHFVSSAQMANTMMAFDRAYQLGYKRIGFVCEFWRMRFFGVGYTWAQKSLPGAQQLPLLALRPADSFEKQQQELKQWMLQHHPDAILTDNTETVLMLQNLGYRIPQDIGVATTSIHDTEINAGIDQRPYEMGRAAIRILNGLIAEKSFGIPDCCNETLIEGQWVDGSMMPKRTA